MGASDDAIVVGMSAASTRNVRPHLVRIDSRLGTIDGRIETMDGRFIAIEGRLDTTDRRLVAMEGRLETTDGRFVAIEGRLGTLDGQFVAIERRLETADGRLVALDRRLETTDGRLVAIEERLDATDIRFDGVAIQEEFDRRVATLVAREEWKAGRLEDRAEMRRHFLMLSEDFRTQVQIIAEGHAVLIEGLNRLAERIDRLEHDLTSLIVTAFRDLDRRKQDKGPRRSRR